MANDLALAGAPDQARGIEFSTLFTFFSHLKASRSTPLATAELVSLKVEVEGKIVSELLSFLHDTSNKSVFNKSATLK